MPDLANKEIISGKFLTESCACLQKGLFTPTTPRLQSRWSKASWAMIEILAAWWSGEARFWSYRLFKYDYTDNITKPLSLPIYDRWEICNAAFERQRAEQLALPVLWKRPILDELPRVLSSMLYYIIPPTSGAHSGTKINCLRIYCVSEFRTRYGAFDRHKLNESTP